MAPKLGTLSAINNRQLTENVRKTHLHIFKSITKEFRIFIILEV